MNPIRAVARPMLASMFVMGGIDSLRNPTDKAPAVDQVTEPIGEAVPQVREMDNADLVRATGAAKVVGGSLLAIGKMPRLASAVLAATLVPTTMAAHRFWEEDDPAQKTNQQIHFFKNVSMLGGLMIAAMDTEGQPGLVWRAGHAVDHAGRRIDRTRREARLSRKLAKAEAKRRATRATARSAREAKLASKLAKAQAGRKAAEGKRALTPDVLDIGKGVKKLRSNGKKG